MKEYFYLFEGGRAVLSSVYRKRINDEYLKMSAGSDIDNYTIRNAYGLKLDKPSKPKQVCKICESNDVHINGFCHACATEHYS